MGYLREEGEGMGKLPKRGAIYRRGGLGSIYRRGAIYRRGGAKGYLPRGGSVNKKAPSVNNGQ